jgi:diaminopimelate decarboxylase
MLKKVTKFIKGLERQGIVLSHLNIGGGLGIIYRRERPQTAEEFARAVLPILKSTGLKIIMEPGRFISGNSGVLLTQVSYIKKTKAKQFAIVDAGMSDLVRPTLYEAYHEILPLEVSNRGKARYDVVGPICESGDFFAKDRLINRVDEGSFLALMSAGAYGFTMASNYNLRPFPAEVLVTKNNCYLIRARQNYADLLKGEKIPWFLQ